MKVLANRINHYVVLCVLWIVFLGALVVSSSQTTIIPNTIFGLIQQLIVFLVFFYALFVVNIGKYLQKTISVLIGVSILLVGISAAFYLFPTLAEHLPLNNMIFPSFGHNHLAEWLILVLPLSWWRCFEKKSVPYLAISLLFTVALWFSFGRIAIALGLIELLLVILVVYSFQNTQISRLVKGFVLATLLGFVGLLAVVFVIRPSSPLICQHTYLQKLLCKPVAHEDRTIYWSQAIAIWQERPLLGTGLGTFYDSDLKHVQRVGYQSAFAHNSVLHMLAETGLVGTVPFVVLVLVSLVTAAKVTIRSNKPIAYILLISLCLSFLNSLLDFSWSINTIYAGFFLLLALVVSMGLSQSEHRVTKRSKPGAVRVIAVLIVVTAGSLVVGSYFAGSVLYRLQYRTGVKILPLELSQYFKHFRDQYVERTIGESEVARKQLFSVFHNDFEVLIQLMVHAESASEKSEYLNRLLDLNPWYGYSFFDADEYEAANGLERTVARTDDLLAFILARTNSLRSSDYYDANKRFAEQLLTVADHLFTQGKYQKAGQYYQYAQQMDRWILHSHTPVFDQADLSADQIEFVLALDTSSPAYFGQYQSEYGTYAQALLMAQLSSGNSQAAPELFRIALHLTPWSEYDIWRSALSTISAQLDEPQWFSMVTVITEFDDVALKSRGFESAYEVRKRIVYQLQRRALATARQNLREETVQTLIAMQKMQVDSYWTSTQLGNYYLSTGDDNAAKGAFQQCLAESDNQHDDCLYSIRSIEERQPNRDRFSQVSQIILGEKRWQDFQ